MNSNVRFTNYSIASILGLEEAQVNTACENLLTTQQSTKNRARRARTNFSAEAISYLEEVFKVNQYPDINERERLAQAIDASEARIQVWFQNKRSRHRKNRAAATSDVSSSNDSLTSNDSACSSPSNRVNVAAVFAVNFFPVNY